MLLAVLGFSHSKLHGVLKICKLFVFTYRLLKNDQGLVNLCYSNLVGFLCDQEEIVR